MKKISTFFTSLVFLLALSVSTFAQRAQSGFDSTDKIQDVIIEKNGDSSHTLTVSGDFSAEPLVSVMVVSTGGLQVPVQRWSDDGRTISIDVRDLPFTMESISGVYINSMRSNGRKGFLNREGLLNPLENSKEIGGSQIRNQSGCV